MARPSLNPWSDTVRLSEVSRGPVERRLSPDPAQLPAIARNIGVDVLKSLDARVTARPWLDGAELRGRFSAEVVQTCGVTLDPLEQTIDGDFLVRVLPPGSVNLPANDPEELDPEAEDPPEELPGEEIDLAAYVVEHLALEIDPFPRKPDAVFEPPAVEEEASPFAVLRRLKQDDAPE
jgi:uncharacterized metal-binding protein YceD (DUF177 family)